MDIALSPEHRELSSKARAFCDQVLLPHELDVEENRGLREASRPALRKAVCEGLCIDGFQPVEAISLEEGKALLKERGTELGGILRGPRQPVRPGRAGLSAATISSRPTPGMNPRPSARHPPRSTRSCSL